MTVVQHVPLERISAEARQIRLGRVLLTLIAGLFYGLGWVAAKISLGIVWCCVAARVGWQEGRKPHGSTG